MTTIARKAAEEILALFYKSSIDWYVDDVAPIIRRAIDASHKWRSIETAPKDGTRILTFGCLHDDGGTDMGELPFIELSWWYGDGWMGARVGGHHPTHWMPLPAPPKGDAA